MSLGLTKEATIHSLLIGIFTIMVGGFLAHPINLNWPAVIALLEPLNKTWWRLIVIFFSFGFLSLFLAGKGRYGIAEFIGAFAFLALFYPAFSLVALLPEGMGFEGLIVAIGLLITLLSLSALMAILLLKNTGLVKVFFKDVSAK